MPWRRMLTGKGAVETDVLGEARADAQAVSAVVQALDGAATLDEAVSAALEVVRDRYGWAYGSYWRILPGTNELTFALESGDAGEEFRQVTRAASFKEGVGLSGRAWRSRDLVFVPDLAEVKDCVRAPAAQRVGVKSGVCFPIVENDVVVGTMDFFATETLTPTEERLDSLRAIGVLVSQAVSRLRTAADQARAAQDIEAVTTILREVTAAETPEQALTAALDTIRTEFDWAYGSFWRIDESDRALHFAQESGDAGEEFRRVTRTASFKEGVGLSGRAWRARDLVFVEDIGEVKDCVRAPAAQRVGVKSGVCLPIIVGGEVVGTLDFFATRTLILAEGRRSALRTTAFLIAQALERFDASARLTTAGSELVVSIEEVERNVLAATSVAQDGSRLAADANRDVAALGTASAEIGEVVRVIQAIAAQTNLLALNATIEAARAGEAGRGFAVVAGEVKQLAGETATATTTVTDSIATIQAQVQRVTASLGEIDAVVQEINETQTVIGGVLTEQVAVTRAILA